MDERVVTSPRKGGLSVYGTNVLMNMTNVIGGLPTKNSQFTAYEGAEKNSAEYVNEHLLVGNPTCAMLALLRARRKLRIRRGKNRAVCLAFGWNPSGTEPAWSVGANCGNDDVRVVAKMIHTCNNLGLDAIEIGHPLSIYMEATQRGYTNGDGGIDWGDGEKMVELAGKIARREGLGDVMANGSDATAQYFGHPELAMTCKGQGHSCSRSAPE